MITEVYKVIDVIESMSIRKRLESIKQEIRTDSLAQDLINNFNQSKEIYEKYNIKDDFIKAKTKLMSYPLIGKYLDIQNEINMLSIYINNKILSLTGNKDCNKKIDS